MGIVDKFKNKDDLSEMDNLLKKLGETMDKLDDIKKQFAERGRNEKVTEIDALADEIRKSRKSAVKSKVEGKVEDILGMLKGLYLKTNLELEDLERELKKLKINLKITPVAEGVESIIKDFNENALRYANAGRNVLPLLSAYGKVNVLLMRKSDGHKSVLELLTESTESSESKTLRGTSASPDLIEAIKEGRILNESDVKTIICVLLERDPDHPFLEAIEKDRFKLMQIAMSYYESNSISRTLFAKTIRERACAAMEEAIHQDLKKLKSKWLNELNSEKLIKLIVAFDQGFDKNERAALKKAYAEGGMEKFLKEIASVYKKRIEGLSFWSSLSDEEKSVVLEAMKKLHENTGVAVLLEKLGVTLPKSKPLDSMVKKRLEALNSLFDDLRKIDLFSGVSFKNLSLQALNKGVIPILAFFGGLYAISGLAEGLNVKSAKKDILHKSWNNMLDAAAIFVALETVGGVGALSKKLGPKYASEWIASLASPRKAGSIAILYLLVMEGFAAFGLPSALRQGFKKGGAKLRNLVARPADEQKGAKKNDVATKPGAQEEKKVAEVKRQKNEAPRLSFSKEEEAEVAAQKYRKKVLEAINALDMDQNVKDELTNAIANVSKNLSPTEMNDEFRSAVKSTLTKCLLDGKILYEKAQSISDAILAPLSE